MADPVKGTPVIAPPKKKGRPSRGPKKTLADLAKSREVGRRKLASLEAHIGALEAWVEPLRDLFRTMKSLTPDARAVFHNKGMSGRSSRTKSSRQGKKAQLANAPAPPPVGVLGSANAAAEGAAIAVIDAANGASKDDKATDVPAVAVTATPATGPAAAVSSTSVQAVPQQGGLIESFKAQFADVLTPVGHDQLRMKMMCVWMVLQERLQNLRAHCEVLRGVDNSRPQYQYPRAPGISRAVKAVRKRWAVSSAGLEFSEVPSSTSIRRHYDAWASTGAFRVEKPGPKQAAAHR